MLTTNWQADVVIYEIFLFMPLYAVILIAMWFSRKKKKTTFKNHYYTLVLSQGAADFLTVTLFVSQMLPRYFQIGNSFVWSLDEYGAATFYVNSGPQMFILRLVGVLLITTQRYLTICRHQGTLYHMIHVMPSYALFLVHWLVSFALHTPAVLVCDGHFENAQSFFVITSEVHKKTSATIVISTFLICALLTISMYVGIIRMLCSAKKTTVVTVSAKQSRYTNYQEARLCVHIFFLAFMAAAIFAYYILQLMFSNEMGQESLRALRLWYPLISGNMSFANPLLLFLLNRDIQTTLSVFCSSKVMRFEERQ